MSFLLKGHTHEGLDKKYRIIKEAIERSGALTVDELSKIVADAFPKANVQVVHFVRCYFIRAAGRDI